MFDLVVVTAANAAQAKGYRAQLKGRDGFMVIADPGGRRVGSLGATVNLLRKLPEIDGRRILVCHSGGDARRTPGYAAMGKAFVPMRDGRAMLDHIIDEMDKLPARPGILVCCGDVIPYLDASNIRFAPKGVTGVAYPDGPWQARRHGVYVTDGAEGAASGCRPRKVGGFLQKPNVRRGRFLIDTGIMHIDPATAGKMRALPIAGDIYEEFPRLLLEGFASFHVAVAPACRFFHIGSSGELLKLLGRNGRLVDGVEGNPLELAGDNIVTNVPASYGPVRLGKGECLTCLPLEGGEWYPLKYRLADNFKTDGLWERHGLAAKMRTVDHARLLAVRRGQSRAAVEVTAPVRIDFAGGWSDTPPICNELGGTVFNAAVRLDGREPIRVEVRSRRASGVEVRSLDLGKRRVLRSMAEIGDHSDPHDWCALAKAALTVVGYDLSQGPLALTMKSDLPKGSGMGTSSILGACAVKALGKWLRGREPTDDEVCRLVLDLEQEMKTGGGWQDQLGGILPGAKILRSRPGRVQRPKATALAPAENRRLAKFLSSRALLYFTGEKRMARNVLRGVLARYAEDKRWGMSLVRALKSNAERTFRAAKTGDFAAFAAGVNEYWRQKKELDPGSTNDRVESAVARIAPWTEAVSLTGAGGGGFMFVIAKSAAARKRIVTELTTRATVPEAGFYGFDLA